MAASLAVGICYGSLVTVPHGAAILFLCGCVLCLTSFRLLRRGVWALASLCLFCCFAGILRSLLPPVSFLPDVLAREGEGMFSALLARLHTTGLSSTADSLVAAMLLGSREMLAPGVVALYRQAGASHILALSGLHLSILFGCLNFFMLRLINSSWRYLFASLCIVLIWGYALLTNFPVSLCRASLMMTLFILGEINYAGRNMWGTLGLSALCLLLLDPAMLFDVGFQLSFAAVAGIQLYYTPVSDMFRPRHALVRWLWQAWVVSFAAQVFTFPLVLHYFRYISLSGILMSPFYILLATAIMLAALAFLLVTPVVKPVVELLVGAQHGLMSAVVALPWGGVRVAGLSSGAVLLIYAGLLCLLPPLWALRVPENKPEGYRLAMFFRTWPYLTAALLLFTVSYVIG